MFMFGCCSLKVKEVYECDFENCNTTFSKFSDLCYHREKHIVESFVCDKEGCNYYCSARSTLLLHKKWDHDEGMLEEEYQNIEQEECNVGILPIWTKCDLNNCSYRCLFPESLIIHKNLEHR